MYVAFILTLVLAGLFGVHIGRICKTMTRDVLRGQFTSGILITLVLSLIGGIATGALATQGHMFGWISIVMCFSLPVYCFSAALAFRRQ